MRPVYYAEAEGGEYGSNLAILDIRKQWRQQSGTAKSGTRSRPLPATVGYAQRDNELITFVLQQLYQRGRGCWGWGIAGRGCDSVFFLLYYTLTVRLLRELI